MLRCKWRLVLAMVAETQGLFGAALMVVVETFNSTNVENSLDLVVKIHGLICISIRALVVVVDT